MSRQLILAKRKRFSDWSKEQNKRMDDIFLSKLSGDQRAKYEGYVSKRNAALDKLLVGDVLISDVKQDLFVANTAFPGGVDEESIEYWKAMQGIHEFILTQDLFVHNMMAFKDTLEKAMVQAKGLDRIALESHLKTVNEILGAPFDATLFLEPVSRKPAEVLRAVQTMFQDPSFLNLLAGIHRLTFETQLLQEYFPTTSLDPSIYGSQLIIATQYLSQMTTMMSGLGDSFKKLLPDEDSTPPKQSMMANKFKAAVAPFQEKDELINKIYTEHNEPRVWPNGLSNDASVSVPAFDASLQMLSGQKALVREIGKGKWPKGLFLMPGMDVIDFALSWAKLLKEGEIKDKSPHKTALALAVKAYALAGKDPGLQGKVLGVFNPKPANSVGAWIEKVYQQNTMTRMLGRISPAYRKRKEAEQLAIKNKLLPKLLPQVEDDVQSVRSSVTSVSMASSSDNGSAMPISPASTPVSVMSADAKAKRSLKSEQWAKFKPERVRVEVPSSGTPVSVNGSAMPISPASTPVSVMPADAKAKSSLKSEQRAQFKPERVRVEDLSEELSSGRKIPPAISRSLPTGKKLAVESTLSRASLERVRRDSQATTSENWPLFKNLHELFRAQFGDDHTHPTMTKILKLMDNTSGKSDEVLSDLARAVRSCVIADKHAEDISSGMPFARPEHAPHIKELYSIMREPNFTLDASTMERMLLALTEDSDTERDSPHAH